MDDDTPTLICYPFLRLDCPFAVGPWRVVPLFGGSDVSDPVPAYGDGPDDSWASDAFRENATDYLKRFYCTHNPVGCFTPLICPGQRGFLRSPKIVLQAQRASTPNSV